MTNNSLAHTEHIYKLAHKAVEDGGGWCRGSLSKVYTGETLAASIEYSPVVGSLYLTLTVNGRSASILAAKRGYLAKDRETFDNGYVWVLDREEFELWASNVGWSPEEEFTAPRQGWGQDYLSPRARKAKTWADAKYAAREKHADAGPELLKNGLEICVPSPRPNPKLNAKLKEFGFRFYGGVFPQWVRETSIPHDGKVYEPELWLAWAVARYSEAWGWGEAGEYENGNGWESCRIIEGGGSRITEEGTVALAATTVVVGGRTLRVNPNLVRAVAR